MKIPRRIVEEPVPTSIINATTCSRNQNPNAWPREASTTSELNWYPTRIPKEALWYCFWWLRNNVLDKIINNGLARRKIHRTMSPCLPPCFFSLVKKQVISNHALNYGIPQRPWWSLQVTCGTCVLQIQPYSTNFPWVARVNNTHTYIKKRSKKLFRLSSISYQEQVEI